MEANILALELELDWLAANIQTIIENYLSAAARPYQDLNLAPSHDLPGDAVLTQLLEKWQLNYAERMALALAIAPHLRPQMLDIFLATSSVTGRNFSEFGGVNAKQHGGFLPSGQTLAFLLSANHLAGRLDYLRLFAPEHRFSQEQILSLQSLDDNNGPANHGLLHISSQWLHYLQTGQQVRPEREPGFPARPLSCEQDWSDLILEPGTMRQLQEIRDWIQHGPYLMQDLGLLKKIKPGYRALFYGPPGTGKTLSTALLGKSLGRAVYRVDLSLIVSKYIGETEKNLGKVFDVAQYRDWILFFDEADALFGKRTAANNSNDRHANQQTGYLLQRIEDFPGVVILASNLKANLDEAFTRRFQAMVHFAIPAAEQRLQLWRAAFAGLPVQANLDWHKLAQDCELAGGAIINILRTCALDLVAQAKTEISQDDIRSAIRRELAKESKTLRFT